MVSTTEDDSAEADRSESEREALRLIRENDGIYQSQLWKALDTSSRTGSRIAKSLAESGVITRTETTHNGRKTYELEIAASGTPESRSPAETREPSLPSELEGASPLVKSIVSFLQSRGEVPITRVDREVDGTPQEVDEAMRELIERDIVSIERKTLYGREQDVVSYLGV
ncbi:MAG: helix-turn-helix transcriptional regulator [Halodesulfurarchaeum sp.]